MTERGCGSRVEGGLYATVETSCYGMPVEHFLIDPVIPWNEDISKSMRAPMIVPSKKVKGLYHVIIGVGKNFYPFVPDFVEEVKVMGVSKRFPRNFDVSKLTPGKSRMILLHQNAIPSFKYKVNVECPKKLVNGHECIGALWPLSALKTIKEKHVVIEDSLSVKVHTPATTYYVDMPDEPEMRTKKKFNYKSGLFASFPIHSFEYVTKKNKVPKKLVESFQKTKYKLEVCKE